VVLAVAGEKVADREALFRRIRQVGPAGTALTLQVLQQGGLREIEVRSIDRADFLQRSQRGRGI
jgi:hypothetical protein